MAPTLRIVSQKSTSVTEYGRAKLRVPVSGELWFMTSYLES